MSAWKCAALAVLCSAAAGAAWADDGERPADDGFARIEARLCSEFGVCEPPCGTTADDAAAGADRPESR